MTRERIADLCRWILGAVFCFSGIVKCVDPVGTAVFVEKYLATYSLGALLGVAIYIAVTLSVVEFSLGVLLLSGRPHRITTIATTLFMAVFTIITLLSATVLPIGDCGCFGDAVRLTPVQTLLKNLLLLPMAVLMFAYSEKGHISYVALLSAVALSLGVSLYSLRYQPIIDFMPYTTTTNLREGVAQHRAKAEESVANILIFKHKATGQSVEFDASNVECWSNPDLEYVDSRVESDTARFPLAELVVADAAGEDVTLELLERSGRVAWLTIYDAKALRRSLAHVRSFVASDCCDSYVVVTSLDVDAVSKLLGVECYEADAMTLRTMNRSKVGVMILDDGVIVRKSDVRDI